MKTIIIGLAVLLTLVTAVFGQCGKTLILSSSKTDHVDAAGKLINSDKEKVEIEITKTTIDIAVDGTSRMKGTVTSNTCNWKVPFKTGKTVINALIAKDGGKKSTLTIEGKDGKVTAKFVLLDNPGDTATLVLDQFEAKLK
ncbi:MAG: hypothetical protein V4577_28795 [Bacteroidota bacterium]